MRERPQSPLYGLQAGHEAEKLVTGIAREADPNSEPQKYAGGIFNAVKRYCQNNDPVTALAIVDAAETDDISPALLWIGKKFVMNRNVDGIKAVLAHSELDPLLATGLVSEYMHEFYDLEEGSDDYKQIRDLVAHSRFTEDNRQHLEEELISVFER